MAGTKRRKERDRSLYAEMAIENDRRYRRGMIEFCIRASRGDLGQAAEMLGIPSNMIRRRALQAGFTADEWSRLRRDAARR